MCAHEADDASVRPAELASVCATLAARPYARRGISVRDVTVRVLLVDRHVMIREGLRMLLQTAPDLLVVGEAGTGTAALELVVRLTPHIIVLDIDMPDTDGTSVVRDLGRQAPDVWVLALSVHAEHERLLSALGSGARGYLPKDAASSDLVDAIRVVASGDVYVRPAAARLLARALVPQPHVETPISRFAALSAREQTVLRLVAQGYNGTEIAKKLGVSTKTVDAYKRRVHEKLGLQHRTEYVRFAIAAELLKY